jgi:NAD(P)-dependent dehydrogenase (short-subunit alcohol dehydrogenase family)
VEEGGRKTLFRSGRIDILVNNAGITGNTVVLPAGFRGGQWLLTKGAAVELAG